VLVGGNGTLRCLDAQSGSEEWTQNNFLGLEDTFALDDVIVGALAQECQAVHLRTKNSLWRREFEVPSGAAFVAGSGYVIAPREGVWAFDLLTGMVRWHRPESDFVGPARKTGCVWEGKFISIIGGSVYALDVESGQTIWKTDQGFVNWLPYQGRAYNLGSRGRYIIHDLASGEVLFQRDLGPYVPERVKMRKKGLTVGVEEGKSGPRWRDPLLAVSDTHTFVSTGSGQIVVLERDTGEVEQVVEIPGMPRGEPVIYENNLLLTDFNAFVHCFRGAD
jgi:outer membrane protein assembly factor BamB